MVKNNLHLIVLLTVTTTTLPFFILWDLSEVLVYQDHAAIALQLNPLNILRYTLEDQKNPMNLAGVMMEALYCQGKQEPSELFPAAVSQGYSLPKLWCDLLCGTITNSEMITRAQECINETWNQKKFSSKLERDLIEDLISITFTPEKISRHILANKNAISLLKKCSSKTGTRGTPEHTVALVANWERESFSLLSNDESIAKIFGCFAPEHIFVSSKLHTMKIRSSFCN